MNVVRDLSQGLAASAINDYDVAAVRKDFPILSRVVHGKPLVYLDNGASAQKPRAVLDSLTRFYENDYSNVHRGLHALSTAATEAYENARARVARHLNAATPEEIVFTRGATEAINLVAHGFLDGSVQEGDEVIISHMEHHANIVPWQLLRDRRGIVLRVVPVGDDGVLDMDAFRRLLSPRTRLVAITHCSNVLGTINPVAEIVHLAHTQGVPVMLDGAQAMVHGPVDVQALGADFYVFTGHKLYGPTGIGALYGKAAQLERMSPFLGGGDMIRSVSFEKTVYADPPQRFEAGTPPIAQAIGLAAAIDYIDGIGVDRIVRHEQDLLRYAHESLASIKGLRILGVAPGKAAIVSFVIEDAHPHDIATIIDRDGVAVRAGHHCAQPLMERFGVAATTRASFGMYNTRAEIDVLVAALRKAQRLLA